MQYQANPAHGPTCVADGYGLKIHVRHGHLLVEDGRGRDRRARRYNRATSKLKRLIVLGQSGYVTLDALQWLRDVGAALVQIDADGRLIAVTARQGTDRPALRRAQAKAPNGPAGLDFACWVLGKKLTGQASVLASMGATHFASRVVDVVCV